MNDKLFKNAMKLRFSGKTNEAIDIYKKIIEESINPEEVLRAKGELDRINASKTEYESRKNHNIDENLKKKQAIMEKDNILLTTCSFLEGYKVIEQLGLVSGEVVLKLSFSDRVSASLDDFGSALSLKMTEMTGTMSLLEDAKEYSLDKMKLSAAMKGANAIIGIDRETSFGEKIMHITINGTAVKVEKIENFPK